tara:strand:- start:351 stop:1604 length:1254 start_codon:yes stop_codon:yes gene_type:complete
LIFKNSFKNLFSRLLSIKSNSKLLFIFNFFILIFLFDISKAETNNSVFQNDDNINIEYLESKNELEDYILDSGDSILIDFVNTPELSGVFQVNQEGEIFLPRIETTYVRGLTQSELKNLLEIRFNEFLIQPEIKIRIVQFKASRVLIRGEVRNPGIYEFPAYRSGSFITLDNIRDSDTDSFSKKGKDKLIKNEDITDSSLKPSELIIKRSNEKITTISDVLRAAGGITSLSDLSKISIVRDIPIGKGGGKKNALINFNSYLNQSDPSNDIRIFDGDSLFIPKLNKNDPNQIPKSILSGISPKFISVNLYGRVENPGVVKLPLEAVLSDAIDISGPIRPLSGKIVLIRYNPDGTILKKNISYSSRAKRGSNRNPFLKENDLISVKNSFIGKATGVIREFTAPFVGIYSTKEIIEGFTD